MLMSDGQFLSERKLVVIPTVAAVDAFDRRHYRSRILSRLSAGIILGRSGCAGVAGIAGGIASIAVAVERMLCIVIQRGLAIFLPSRVGVEITVTGSSNLLVDFTVAAFKLVDRQVVDQSKPLLVTLRTALLVRLLLKRPCSTPPLSHLEGNIAIRGIEIIAEETADVLVRHHNVHRDVSHLGGAVRRVYITHGDVADKAFHITDYALKGVLRVLPRDSECRLRVGDLGVLILSVLTIVLIVSHDCIFLSIIRL